GPPGHHGQERTPELVGLERAVPVGTEYVSAAGALPDTVDPTDQRGDVAARHVPVMNLVPVHRSAEADTARPAEGLLGTEGHLDRQQAEPGHRSAPALHVTLDTGG